MSAPTQGKLLNEEALAFDQSIQKRLQHGFVPDWRHLRRVEWFQNNPWREPEFAEIQWGDTFNLFLNEAKAAGSRVLEVGCGNGMLALEMARSGLDVTGVDLSQQCIQTAEHYRDVLEPDRLFGSLNYQCGDFMTLESLPKGGYDVVYFFRSFHHFPNPDQVIDRVCSLLKPHGKLLLCEPIRAHFGKLNAELALLLRHILPTWLNETARIDSDWTEEKWQKGLEEIHAEYTYADEHHQSVMDNSVDSLDTILECLAGKFSIMHIRKHDAFIDKLIGGLRGEKRVQIARILKFWDNHLTACGLAEPTSITLVATILKTEMQ